jgi:protein gp37
MSDLFQDAVPAGFVRKVWQTMARAKWHAFQILTKRPDRMRAIICDERLPLLGNVWLGTSVESRDYVGRIAELRKTPASVRFISFEPLLGPVGKVSLRNIDWAIVGGESGPGARPMDERWVTEIQDQCQHFSTAFFFKQWGGVNKKKTGRMFKGRTWNEYPASLSVAAE